MNGLNNQVNNQPKTPKLIAISVIILIIVILVIGAIWWLISNSTTEAPTPILNNNKTEIPELYRDNPYYCEQDSDCVIQPGCCTKESVNIYYYQAPPKDGLDCPTVLCDHINTGVKCQNNRCETITQTNSGNTNTNTNLNTNSQTNQNTSLNTNSSNTNQTNSTLNLNTNLNTNPANTNQIADCATLGQAGPNYSLGPTDPKKEVKCCEGLLLKDPLNAFRDDCEAGEGFGTVCIACGDSMCDSTYESTCNCPEDCE